MSFAYDLTLSIKFNVFKMATIRSTIMNTRNELCMYANLV